MDQPTKKLACQFAAPALLSALLFLGAGIASAGEILHLDFESGVENKAPGGPVVVEGNRIPNTVTIPVTGSDVPGSKNNTTSLEMDGDDVLMVEEAAALEPLPSGTFTIMAFVKVEDIGADAHTVFNLLNHWNYLEKVDRSIQVNLEQQAGRIYPTVSIQNPDDSGSRRFVGDEDVRFDPGTWVHIAVVADGKLLRFFLNGEESAKTEPIEKFRGSAMPAYIGGSNVGRPMGRVLLDDVVVSSAALSRAEIQKAAEH